MIAVSTEPDISVVVPTFRRSAGLARLADALEAQTLDHARFEVVIVDDCSPDDTEDVLRALAERVSFTLRPLRTARNGGPAAARNLGWRSSRGRYVAFTDDDCVPRPEWLEQALTTCRATPDLAVLQGATLRPDGPYPYGPGTVYRETLHPSPYFEGCNLVFPRAVLERTGGFDEGFGWYGEDTAAGWAALEAGGEWVFDETAAVEHEIVERPFRWILMMAWREGRLVDVAARHPELRRRAFWRPWAHRPSNVAFILGMCCTLAAPRRPSALVGWLPWLWLRRPRQRSLPASAAVVSRRFVEDGVVAATMVRSSLRNRIVVL